MAIDQKLNDIRNTQAELRVMQDEVRKFGRDGGGGGTTGGMSEDWQKSVDSQLTQLHCDVRQLLLGLIGGVLFLLGGGIGAYLLLDSNLDEVDKGLTAVKIEQAGTNARLQGIDDKLKTLDAKLDRALEKK